MRLGFYLIRGHMGVAHHLYVYKCVEGNIKIESFQVSRFGGRSPDFGYNNESIPISDLECKSPDLLQKATHLYTTLEEQ